MRNRWRLVLDLLFLVSLAAAGQAWALPECPAAHQVTLSGSVYGQFYGGTVQSHAITMYPCEEFWIDLAASENDPWRSPNITIGVYNSSNTNLAGTTWTVDSSLWVPNALPLVGGIGFPHPGTRDPRGIVTRIDVSNYWTQAAYPVSYTLTVHFHARPGYNRGGLSFQDAYGPVAQGTAVHASMASLEENYYRVTLAGNGSLTLSGTLVNQNWNFGIQIGAAVYNLAQQSLGTILNTGVSNNSAHDPHGATATFTSSTFTNPSSSPQDFYVKIANGPGAWLFDSTITFSGDLAPPPTLTLYLDVDGNFDAAGQSPSSDHLTYIPGADPATGASVSLPQSVQLIAAYVNASGQIVPPPSWAEVRFTLNDTSAFLGVAMNWGSQTDPDYHLSATTASFDTSNDTTKKNTARVTLICEDYGGFTTASVTDEVSTPSFRLPDDGPNNNWLPSAGWYTSTGNGVDQGAAGDDTDSLPTGGANSGDGLSAFEEFRGFMVMGHHIRTNPGFKDVFVFSQFTDHGLGTAWELPIAVHAINGNELAGDRRIAPNYTNSGYGGNIPGHFVGTLLDGSTSEQLGIIVFDDQTITDIPQNQNTVATGETNGQFNYTTNKAEPGPPWAIGPYAARVYVIRIMKLSPTHNDGTTPDSFDSDKIDQTIAHEIGHNVGMDDVPWTANNACPPGADTIMISNYFQQTNNGNDCRWNHIPFLYGTTILGQLRVQ